jgi:type IV secretory pathway VirB3-like protein
MITFTILTLLTILSIITSISLFLTSPPFHHYTYLYSNNDHMVYSNGLQTKFLPIEPIT